MATVMLLQRNGDVSDVVLGARRSTTVPAEGWQRCAECGSRMRYLLEMPMTLLDPKDTRRLIVTVCDSDPGLCDEWEPFSGGNRAYLVDETAADEPSRKESSKPRKLKGSPVSLAARQLEVDDATVALMLSGDGQADVDRDHGEGDLADDTPDEDQDALTDGVDDVVGHIGTGPLWYQEDETPTCPCGVTMRFVLQLDEIAHPEFNFGGGGIGYAFICPECPSSAAWLFQC